MEEKVISWTVVEGKVLAIKLGDAVWVRRETDEIKSTDKKDIFKITKICRTCHLEKPLICFYPANREYKNHRSLLTSYRTECKKCCKERMAAYDRKRAALDDRKISDDSIPLTSSNCKDSKALE